MALISFRTCPPDLNNLLAHVKIKLSAKVLACVENRFSTSGPTISDLKGKKTYMPLFSFVLYIVEEYF